jgi:putative endonuclease
MICRPGAGRGPILVSEIRGYVYILTNKAYGTVYVGKSVGAQGTSGRRVHEKHAISRLVWYECHDSIQAAIPREKQIKAWRRDWKVNLIQAMNPDWRDLYDDLTA